MWILEALGVLLIWALGAAAGTFMLLELFEPKKGKKDDTVHRD
jgi:hypothetical protein